MEKPNVNAITVFLDLNSIHVTLELTQSPEKLILFTSECKFLQAVKGDCLIGLNHIILIDKTPDQIKKMLMQLCKKEGNTITFTVIKENSFSHPSLAKVTKVIFQLIFKRSRQ